jgi:hypothetical protein
MSRLLFEDIFEVLQKDPDDKIFDKGAAQAQRLLLQLCCSIICASTAACAGKCNMSGLSSTLCCGQCRAFDAEATCMRWTCSSTSMWMCTPWRLAYTYCAACAACPFTVRYLQATCSLPLTCTLLGTGARLLYAELTR